jgi:hypothetical protein
MVSNEMPMDDSFQSESNHSNANVVYEGEKGSAHPLRTQNILSN